PQLEARVAAAGDLAEDLPRTQARQGNGPRSSIVASCSTPTDDLATFDPARPVVRDERDGPLSDDRAEARHLVVPHDHLLLGGRHHDPIQGLLAHLQVHAVLAVTSSSSENEARW